MDIEIDKIKTVIREAEEISIQLGEKYADAIVTAKLVALFLTDKPGSIQITESTVKPLSIKEFTIETDPKDGTEMVLYFGYYLEKYKGVSCFNLSDLKDCYMNAKERQPPNINDKVNLNIRKGFMMEAQEKKNNSKAWILTRKGEEFVKQKIQGNEND